MKNKTSLHSQLIFHNSGHSEFIYHLIKSVAVNKDLSQPFVQIKDQKAQEKVQPNMTEATYFLKKSVHVNVPLSLKVD